MSSQLPIVPGSEVNTPVAGVKIDPSSFRQAALMKGQVGAAIGEAGGEFFGKLATQIQDSRNAKMIFNADLTMRKTHDDFLASLTTNPELAQDPGKWMPAYKQQTDAVREQLMSQPMGPKVKDHVTMMADGWEQATSAALNTAALLRETSDTKKAGIENATYSFENGDIENGKKAFQSLFEAGIIGPKERDARITMGMQSAADAQAMTLINNDPLHAPQAVKQFEGQMNPNRYRQVVRAATENMHRTQASNLNDLAGMMDESPDGTIDPKLVQQKIKDGEITARGGQGLINRMAQKRLSVAKEDFNVGMANLQDHDFTQDKQPEQTAAEMKETYVDLPTALRTRLYGSIDKRLATAKKMGETAERPVEKQIFDQMKEDRNSNGYTIPVSNSLVPGETHWFRPNDPDTYQLIPAAKSLGDLRNPDKVSDADIEKQFGKGTTRDALIRAEQSHYATMQAKMRDWFKDPANAKASYEDANTYRLTLEKPFVMGQVKDALQPQSGYKTKEDVRAAYLAGSLTKAQAKKLLDEQFQMGK